MDLSLQKDIFLYDDDDRLWDQTFLFPHGEEIVDLSVACGDDAVTPPNAPNQPDEFHIPSVYRFDPQLYCGETSYDDLSSEIKKALPGATFIKTRGDPQGLLARRYVWNCNFNLSSEKRLKKNFEITDSYIQPGVRPVYIKNRRNLSDFSNSISRMAGKNEKKRMEKKAKKNKWLWW